MEENMTEIRKRARVRNLPSQLQSCLDECTALSKEPLTELTVAKMQFLRVRLSTLTIMAGRARHDKWKEATAEVAVLKKENEKLKQELAAALAKPVAVRPLTDVEQALAKYEASKQKTETGGAS
jgi:hypothetical protein